MTTRLSPTTNHSGDIGIECDLTKHFLKHLVHLVHRYQSCYLTETMQKYILCYFFFLSVKCFQVPPKNDIFSSHARTLLSWAHKIIIVHPAQSSSTNKIVFQGRGSLRMQFNQNNIFNIMLILCFRKKKM